MFPIHSRLYLCHHSARNKPELEDNKKGKSKNLHCQARIDILIKKNTPGTRRYDTFIKASYFWRIKQKSNIFLKMY